MKITIYTISECQFSKAEKDYLTAHNLTYEEKNLEQNREWLTEMLTVSNNFAGTPVTKIEKDDGQIIVLKGFTQEEFDEVLGFKKEEQNQELNQNQNLNELNTLSSPQNNNISTQNQPTINQPLTSNNLSNYNSTTTTNPSSFQNQSTNETNNQNIYSQPNDPLASIISNLEQKANINQPNQPSSDSPYSQFNNNNNNPNIPNFND